MDKNSLFYLIVGILVLQYLVDVVIDFLNAKNFSNQIPEDLEDVFAKEEYLKSQAYKKSNYNFGFWNSTFSLLLTLAFFFLGGFEWLDLWVRTLSDKPVVMALLYFGTLMLGSSLIGLPFSYYKTFGIEEAYGFNKTSKTTFWTDLMKSWVLTALLGGGLLTLVIFLLQVMGPNFWWYAWIAFGLFMIFINLFYSKLIVPIFNKQTLLEEGNLKIAIENYAKRVGFELHKIFVIDGSKRSTKANAYFSGFGKQKRITLFDTLINDLEEEEIVAVLAHEVGHYKRKHIVFNLSASLLMTGFTLYVLSLFVNNPELSQAIGVNTPSFHAAFIGFVLLYSPISAITGLGMNYLSRKFEFQADDFAKETFAAQPLITSLKKLSKNSLSNLTPHPAYVFFHYSHPPLAERIRNLKA